tara:strand:- start:8 stop:493 length:486 start_codon:yes stop_codon:yes gene_type:complete
MKAFTLIELLVVVAIIGILAAVGVTTFNGFQEKAKVSTVKANFKSVVKYITVELMKCELGELKIVGGRLNCPPDAFGLGVYTKFIEPFRNGEHIFRNPYDNGLQVDNGNIYNRDEDVGYIRLNIVSIGSDQFIRIKSCIKLPCSDTSNHIEEIIVSDMMGK